MSTCAFVFARHPEPGEVKTRLTPALSPASAATLYTAFLRDALDLLRGSGAERKVVAYTPPERGAEMAALVDDPALELIAQPAGDLGARMAWALAGAAAGGAGRAVILGSDCPSLAPETIDRALEALASRDVVLGPALDGGYYLVGCAGPPPGALFSGIEWGTDSVLRDTLDRLGDATLALLDPWFDVDTPADLRLLATYLEALDRAGIPRAAQTREALTRLLGQAHSIWY